MDALDLSRAVWRKSARSGPNGDCVEVAPAWRKTSRSGGNGNCVEVAGRERALIVRDSKDPAGPVLAFSRRGWAAFVRGVRDGGFNPPQ